MFTFLLFLILIGTCFSFIVKQITKWKLIFDLMKICICCVINYNAFWSCFKFWSLYAKISFSPYRTKFNAFWSLLLVIS